VNERPDNDPAVAGKRPKRRFGLRESDSSIPEYAKSMGAARYAAARIAHAQ
jgi:hypothetical protein